MTATLLGSLKSNMTIDKDSHRTYDITWLVESTDVDDGPAVIAFVAGLPLTGTAWTFGNDNDPWATCWPNMKIREVLQDRGEWTGQWTIEQVFTTKPLSRCQTIRIENPIAEPARLSGTFTRYTKEATHDRNGYMLISSSNEFHRQRNS